MLAQGNITILGISVPVTINLSAVTYYGSIIEWEKLYIAYDGINERLHIESNGLIIGFTIKVSMQRNATSVSEARNIIRCSSACAVNYLHYFSKLSLYTTFTFSDSKFKNPLRGRKRTTTQPAMRSYFLFWVRAVLTPQDSARTSLCSKWSSPNLFHTWKWSTSHDASGGVTSTIRSYFSPATT